MFDVTINSPDFVECIKAEEHKARVILWEYCRLRFIKFYQHLGFTIDEAEDICSETYVKLLQTKCATYNPNKGPFPVWLRVVGKRAGLYRLRQRRKLAKREISLDACLDIPAKDIFVEENMSGWSESQIQVRRATASLRQNDRTIIWDRFVEKLTFDLIADKHGISESVARMRAFRARQRLRQTLERLSAHELPRRTRRIRRRDPPRVGPTGDY
jgi:RNA polymerase sigma factor (sigma-70 family)